MNSGDEGLKWKKGLFLSSVAKIQHHVEASMEEMGLPVCQS